MPQIDSGVPANRDPLVLIVDDFPDALDMYREHLTFKRMRVVTAGTGAECLLLAREHRPDVIFLDIRMAVMTGTQAMQVLRTDPTFSGTPIVALTAYALEDERVAALAAGFDEVISKPFLPDDLVAAVNRLTATRPSTS